MAWKESSSDKPEPDKDVESSDDWYKDVNEFQEYIKRVDEIGEF